MEMIQSFNSADVDCLCGVVYDGNDNSMKPIAYDLGKGGEVVRVREKPDYYDNDIRGIGECIFKRNSLDKLEVLKINPIRKEYEMGDWIQMLVDDRGGSVRVFDLADAYVNINRIEDIERANSIL